MKIELELDDKIVEGLLEAKKKAPAPASLNDIAKTLIQTALVAGGFLKMEDIVEQAFKSAMAQAGIGSLADIGEMLDDVKGSKVGMVGVKIGRDGKVEHIGVDELPAGALEAITGLSQYITGAQALADDTACDCPNCVAARIESTKKYS